MHTFDYDALEKRFLDTYSNKFPPLDEAIQLGIFNALARIANALDRTVKLEDALKTQEERIWSLEKANAANDKVSKQLADAHRSAKEAKVRINDLEHKLSETMTERHKLALAISHLTLEKADLERQLIDQEDA